MNNYICGNLTSDYAPCYTYCYNQYSYSSKAYIVCEWQRKRGLLPVAKWCEAMCDGELVNFFKDHKNCAKGCGRLYY